MTCTLKKALKLHARLLNRQFELFFAVTREKVMNPYATFFSFCDVNLTRVLFCPDNWKCQISFQIKVKLHSKEKTNEVFQFTNKRCVMSLCHVSCEIIKSRSMMQATTVTMLLAVFTFVWICFYYVILLYARSNYWSSARCTSCTKRGQTSN